GEAVGDVQLGAVGGVGELLGEGGEVVLAIGVLDVGDGLGAFVDEVHTSAEQVAGGAHAGGIDVGDGDVAATKQAGERGGVDLVVLTFAAVDGFHVQGMSEDEGDLLLVAEVGEPVPGEQALDGDDEVVAEGGDGLQEAVGMGGQVLVEDDLSGGVKDAQVHGPGMQIDAAVESVLLIVEAHGLLPRYRWGPEPASWLEGTPFLKIPR